MTNTKKPTPKQQAAIDYIDRHNGAPLSVAAICRAADVKGGSDNQYAFIGRLIDGGFVRLSAAAFFEVA